MEDVSFLYFDLFNQFVITIADKVEARILAHSAAVKVGLVKEVTNSRTKEVVRSLRPFAEEFMVDLRWRVSGENAQFELNNVCVTYQQIPPDMIDFKKAKTTLFRYSASKFDAVWLALVLAVVARKYNLLPALGLMKKRS
jgi:hypothetical protein